MITITDSQGFVHLIPRERFINATMLPANVDQGDPPGTIAKFIIFYEVNLSHTGQYVFHFVDPAAVEQLKRTLLTWAAADAPNQLHINAAIPATMSPAAMQASSAIDIDTHHEH